MTDLYAGHEVEVAATGCLIASGMRRKRRQKGKREGKRGRRNEFPLHLRENCDDCDQNQASARSDDKAIIAEAILWQKGED